ncbi:uncharacterized protein LTR77_004402 [Saxophila tyrrhenica]|uniref:Uncharacterized protein n=1 Tax=Saxophila tyrrhenica TaxID=1690608 RepID=A0AAV9PDT5_9PEZI|nr:hypothetical protein LTR77_004402 [Saxophila tyrrhenica]
MRSAIAHAAVAAQRRKPGRQRSTSLSTVPPSANSDDYSPELAAVAASILYRSPLPTKEGRPIYVLNAAAFPDAFEVDYDSLLSYVLARLPGEDELISGTEYEIIFFAGGQPDNATSEKKQGPGMGWYLQAYHVLSRATRKRLQRLYIVHPRTWVRVLVGVFGTIVSPKFRRKIIHVTTLSQLALHIPIERLLIPPAVYLHDRKLSPDIYAPFATGKRAFGVKHPFPKNIDTGETRLPRVLREATSFLLQPACIKTEGIFRIPPNATLSSALKEAYDRGQNFIVWKERGATVVQPGIDQTLLDEVRLEDAYGAHLAASIIKQWYRDLRDPVFPESSYESLKAKYSDPDVQVQPEDLVDLILPASDSSPLSWSGRQILTRHLLPMLSEVAAYEPENKMNPENLGICFSMCLVCGSNQLEDAKVASILKRVLQAAIEMWPELRTGMDMSSEHFYEELQPPADSRDYEDPLEEEFPPRSKQVKEDGFPESGEGHRIILEDAEDAPELERAPVLPPRRQKVEEAQGVPVLPSRPVTSQNVSPIATSSDAPPPVPKRKPAPSTAEPPPRYSTIFDNDGTSMHMAESPATYVPANGFGPPRHGAWSFDEPEKKGFAPQPSDPPPAIEVPKRKALSSGSKPPTEAGTPADSAPTSRRPSNASSIAQEAAQRAAANLAQQAAAAFAERPTSTPILQIPDTEPLNVVQSPESVATSEDDNLFRKPNWPASARPIQPQSLAKPVLPPRQSQTFPLASNSNGNLATTGPRVRAPSPGLLKRMSSMEPTTTGAAQASGSEPQAGAGGGLRPNRLDLKKQSVEDLRRLYEERVSTAQVLTKSGKGRGSASSA